MADLYADVVFNTPAEGTYTYRVPEGVHAVFGIRVSAPFGRRRLIGFVVNVRTEKPDTDFELKEIEKAVDKEPVFDARLLDLAKWLSRMYFCSLGEALACMLPGGKRESRMPVLCDFEMPSREGVVLSDEQRTAVEGICADSGGASYLSGITGSGKTEVFLRAAEHTMSEGRSVIYLVPEISLTHQLTEEVRSRFGDGIAVLHSGLTPSQKLVEWFRIIKGEALFIIGARSAVFAPAVDLGLIVIDEEHEGAYKSSCKPRYHARQTAMYRCAKEGARLVMGSATPSLEARYLMDSGGIKSFNLTSRLSGGTLPRIRLVDMKEHKSCISVPLEKAVRKTHEEGRQTILFLNRRGFSYFFHCKSCGYEAKCRNCSVSLTYHKERNRLVCHYCGYSEEPRNVCPGCGSLDVGYSGFGTEMIEDELSTLFPDLVIERLDTDSVKKKGSMQDILDRFRKGRIDILLGTQMVAKGLNFPGVKLVGIVLADTGLHLPDFRAWERTFNLIVQVSGRAGRYMPDGEVIIQTYNPGHEAIRMAAAGQMEEFYKFELENRRMLGFPPFGRLFRIVFRGKDRERVTKSADDFAARFILDDISGLEASEILGPAECPISMIAGNHRCQIIFRTDNFRAMHSLFNGALRQFSPPSGVYLEADVDPVSLL